MANEVAMLFLIASATFRICVCYSSGAPARQCVSMEPIHGALAQAGESPYKITVRESHYMPGQKVRVSIESSDDSVISGYLIQARRVGQSRAVGMFSAPRVNGRYLGCGNSKVKTATVYRYRRIHFKFYLSGSKGHTI